jgi:hypothetical protein
MITRSNSKKKRPEKYDTHPTGIPANALKAGLNKFCFPAEKKLERLVSISS